MTTRVTSATGSKIFQAELRGATIGATAINEATEIGVLRFIDNTHSPAAEFLHDAVVRDVLVDHGATPCYAGSEASQ